MKEVDGEDEDEEEAAEDGSSCGGDEEEVEGMEKKRTGLEEDGLFCVDESMTAGCGDSIGGGDGEVSLVSVGETEL